MPREEMKALGSDVVLTIADLKTNYNAIGSYLHMPSLGQVLSNNVPDESKLKTLCENIIGVVEKVLNSPIWNSTFGNFTTIKCVNSDCKASISRRIPIGKVTYDARCYECAAEYTVSLKTDGSVHWDPKMKTIRCSESSCSNIFPLWPKEVKPGTNWHCPDCGTHNELRLGVVTLSKDK